MLFVDGDFLSSGKILNAVLLKILQNLVNNYMSVLNIYFLNIEISDTI